MRRVCVYTAIFGAYDSLQAVPKQDVTCDCLGFTDNARLENPGAWRMVHAPIVPDSHPRIRARYFKILHERVFVRDRLIYGARPWGSASSVMPPVHLKVHTDRTGAVRSVAPSIRRAAVDIERAVQKGSERCDGRRREQ